MSFSRVLRQAEIGAIQAAGKKGEARARLQLDPGKLRGVSSGRASRAGRVEHHG